MDVQAEDMIDDGAETPTPQPTTGAAVSLALWVFSYVGFWGCLLLFTGAYKKVFMEMGVALPLVTVWALNLGDFVRNSILLVGPLLLAVVGLSLLPFKKMDDKRHVMLLYLLGGLALIVLTIMTFLSLQLPIWEMDKALGK